MIPLIILVEICIVRISAIIKISFDLDVPVGFVLDDGGCSFSDVVEGPGFDAIGFSVINRTGWVEKFGISSDKT